MKLFQFAAPSILGLYTLTFAAVPLVLPIIPTGISPSQTDLPTLSTQLANAASILNSTGLAESTSGSSLEARPPDPSTFEILSTSLSLTFSKYTAAIPLSDVLTVLIQTLFVSIDKIVEAGGDVPFEITTEYHHQHAFLIVHAGGIKSLGLTYDKLASVIKGILGFVQEYGSFGSNIEVEDVELGNEIGNCFLTYV